MKLEKEKKPRQDSLKKDMQYSLIFHALVLGFFSIKNLFFSGPEIDYKSAIRVDVVDLPDKIKKEARTPPAPPKKEEKKPQATPKPKPKPKPEPKAKPEPDKVNLKKEQTSAIEKLKAIERIKQQKEREDSQQNAIERLKEYKGNVLSKGGALEGVIADQYNAYIGQLDQHVKSFWDLPRWLSEEKLVASVSVRIDQRGFVLSRRIVNSSGNPTFDDIALNTVDNASPFPAPPSNLEGALQSKGFIIEFDKQEE